MKDKTRHIGILGGTFDPIHNAHIQLAKSAYEEFGLDEVWILPNGNPPHKKDTEQVSVGHRLEMIRLAIEGISGLVLCDLEANSGEYHYTYETLTTLSEDHPDTQFYFIMGADSLYYFDTWRCPEIISQKSILLVATRDHHSHSELHKQIQKLQAQFPCDIRLMSTPNMDISSETIRDKISRQEPVNKLVPHPVVRYIESNRLYREKSV